MSGDLIEARKAFADRRALANVFSGGAYFSESQVAEAANRAARGLYDEVEAAVPGSMDEHLNGGDLITARIVVEGNVDDEVKPAPTSRRQ